MMTRISSHMLSLSCSAAVTALAEEWPEFRGPTGQGISSATNVPTEWSATKNIVWQTAVPGRGWSSPVLSKGRIYLTTSIAASEGTNVSLRVLCLDAALGNILWNTEVLQPDPAAVKVAHPKNSPASPTPLVRDDRVYA